MGQDRGRDRADAARRPGHQNLALLGRQPVVFERHHRQHRGEAGGADRHRLARGQPGRQRHQPVGLHPRPLGIAAPMRLAHPPAGQNHLVARLVAGVRRGLDRAGEVDPRHMRIAPHQPAARADAEPVLVVQRRIFDGDRHLGLGQAVVGQILHRGMRRAVLVLLDQQGLEHRRVSFASTADAGSAPPAFRGRVTPRPIMAAPRIPLIARQFSAVSTAPSRTAGFADMVQ